MRCPPQCSWPAVREVENDVVECIEEMRDELDPRALLELHDRSGALLGERQVQPADGQRLEREHVAALSAHAAPQRVWVWNQTLRCELLS
jgi:hypothetical protein